MGKTALSARFRFRHSMGFGAFKNSGKSIFVKANHGFR